MNRPTIDRAAVTVAHVDRCDGCGAVATEDEPLMSSTATPKHRPSAGRWFVEPRYVDDLLFKLAEDFAITY